jgi:hypothetical protein
MKFFVDTADLAEIREAQAMGMLDGVTTNPSLVASIRHPEHVHAAALVGADVVTIPFNVIQCLAPDGPGARGLPQGPGEDGGEHLAVGVQRTAIRARPRIQRSVGIGAPVHAKLTTTPREFHKLSAES